jgi:HK97 family phage major capsid protein
VTRELVETWSPATQANLNDRLSLAVARGADSAFLNPDNAGTADESPASVLNGISPLGDLTNSAAGALTDIEALLAAHVNASSDLDRVLIAMHPRTALTLSLMQNSNGNSTFPALTAVGGSIAGVPVATSVGCVRSGSPTEKVVCAIDGAKIVLADDGGVEIATSNLAAVELDSAPSARATVPVAAANVVSAYQTHATLLRVVRFQNWQRAAASGVSWMTSTF